VVVSDDDGRAVAADGVAKDFRHTDQRGIG